MGHKQEAQNMAQDIIASGQERPFHTRWIVVDLTGTTDIAVVTNLRKVYGVIAGWHETPDNDTYQVIAYPSSTNNAQVTLRCTHATTKKAILKVIGTN